MFHMLTCFNLRPGIELGAFRKALADYTAHLQALDLVESNSPIGQRQSDTIMDTDDERHHQYFATLVLLRFSGELFAHSRPAISNWTGLWYPSVEWRRIGL